MLSRLAGVLGKVRLGAVQAKGGTRRGLMQSSPPPRRQARTWGAAILSGFACAELVLFLGSYWLWRRMNHSQEFRLYMRSNYPTILEGDFMRAILFFLLFHFKNINLVFFVFLMKGFYQIGERLGNLETRKADSECWEQQKEQKRTE